MEAIILSLIGIPFLLIAFVVSGLFIVKAREEVVVLFFGKYSKTFKNPGIKWYSFVGREIRRISTQDTTTENKKEELVSNLLVVLCSGESAKPVLKVDSVT